jgi:hypothetical protein
MRRSSSNPLGALRKEYMNAEKGMGEYKLNLLQSYIELKLGLAKKSNLADRVIQ